MFCRMCTGVLGWLVIFQPTHLGILYASQIFDAANAQLGDLDTMFQAGDFAPLKNWLNVEVHRSRPVFVWPAIRKAGYGGGAFARGLNEPSASEKLVPIYGL